MSILGRTKKTLSAFLIVMVFSPCCQIYLAESSMTTAFDFLRGIWPHSLTDQRNIVGFLDRFGQLAHTQKITLDLEDIPDSFFHEAKHRQLSKEDPHRPWRLSHFETDSIQPFWLTRSAVLARITHQNQKKTTVLILGSLLRKALFCSFGTYSDGRITLRRERIHLLAMTVSVMHSLCASDSLSARTPYLP